MVTIIKIDLNLKVDSINKFLILMVKLPEKGHLCSKIGLANCCCYMQLHMVLREKKEYASWSICL